ncbi:MAG TPA: diaminopropionate ammonia-lyase [Gemmatimonadales bacterium]|jgi:diaminopropionate ammonia-lyase|nr:diaminopropionate ammonia-lyase [Gemmatimonadales bacterium]
MAFALLNPYRRGELRTPPAPLAATAFHRRLPGYMPTPLRQLRGIARRLGIAGLYLKDESNRLGLPAYKVLGAVWAIYRIIERLTGERLDGWGTLDELGDRLRRSGIERLTAATDGNHGRGVARVARWLGLGAEVFVPRGTARARVEAIASEGAVVTVVDGTYDATVERAAGSRRAGDLLVQDHGWPGYEEVPAWVAEGYATIFREVDETLTAEGAVPPDLVLVQIGVGTLASAVVRHYRRAGLEPAPRLVGVEPTGAACALRSIEAGHPVRLEVGADASIMAGLNCGTPSSQAWPLLRDGLDGFVAVEDESAQVAMRWLAAEGVMSGESGAAGLAGLIELRNGAGGDEVRRALGLTARTVALVISTEGVTDPASYGRIVGSRGEGAAGETA